jgi:hypothetical protein
MLVPVFRWILFCFTFGLILKTEAADSCEMLVPIYKIVCVTPQKVICLRQHTHHESGFKQFAPCSVTVHLHETSTFIPDMERLKCILWVSNNYNLLHGPQCIYVVLFMLVSYSCNFQLCETICLKPVYWMCIPRDKITCHVSNQLCHLVRRCIVHIVSMQYCKVGTNVWCRMGLSFLVLMTCLYSKHL